MSSIQKLTDRESMAINIMKAIAILSVLAAHTISVSHADLLSNVVSSVWSLFGRVGVIIFFVVSGFLYSRSPQDRKIFWKKKCFRILIPWAFCASATYALAVVLGRELSPMGYLQWVFGSGTWYYYLTIYTLFLFIFPWFWKKDWLLLIWIGVQTLSLALASFEDFTAHFPFWATYLNPLQWIGYFSLGILIRRHRLDIRLRAKKWIVAIAAVLAILSLYLLYTFSIFTYFHIVSSVFCLCALIVSAAIAYRAAACKLASYIGNIGIYSFCIYLLHMQIVQGILAMVPDSIAKLLFAPWIALGVMLALIYGGLFLCRKLPFGNKIKMLVGL